MMHKKLAEIGTDLAAEKAESNRRRGRGSGPGKPPKKIGLAKSRLLGRLAGKEAENKDDEIMGNLTYHERKGVSA